MFLLCLQWTLLLATAGDPSETITWRAPPSCADASTLPARVEALRSSKMKVEARVEVTIEPRAEAFEVSIRLEAPGDADVRRLESSSCETAVQAAALVVAVALDAWSQAQARVEPPHEPPRVAPIPALPEPPPSSGPPRSATPRPPATSAAPALPRQGGPSSTAAVEPEPSPSSDEVMGFAVVRGGASSGSLPGWTGVLEAGGGVRWRWLAVELTAGHRFARLAAFARGGSVDVRAWTGGLRLRAEPRVGPIAFPIGVGVVLGDLVGSGRGVPEPRTRHELWGAAVFGGGLQWIPLRWLAFGVEPELMVSFVRPRFGLVGADGARLVGHQPGRLGVSLRGGVEVRFR